MHGATKSVFVQTKPLVCEYDVYFYTSISLSTIIYGDGGKVKEKLTYVLIIAHCDGNMGTIIIGAYMTVSKGLLVLFIVSAAKPTLKQVAHTQSCSLSAIPQS